MSDDEDFEQLLSGLADALTDPVSQPSVHVPDALDVTAIRRKTGLSQPAFASRIGIPVATLRNWEQGHRSPRGPARVLLALLDRNPRIVEEVLGG
jgi:putative transcriptional regulator